MRFGDDDWEGLKKGVRAIFESGGRHPAVIVSQNGQFGVGQVDETYAKILAPITDPITHVYFVNTKSSVGLAAKMTWMELQANFF